VPSPSIKVHVKSPPQSPCDQVPFDQTVNAHIGRPPKAELYPPAMGGFTIHPTATWCSMNGIERPPPQNYSSPKVVRYETAYCLPLNDKLSHPPHKVKCPFPCVPTKIVGFVNKTKKLIVFSSTVKKTAQTSMQALKHVQPSTHAQLSVC